MKNGRGRSRAREGDAPGPAGDGAGRDAAATPASVRLLARDELQKNPASAGFIFSGFGDVATLILTMGAGDGGTRRIAQSASRADKASLVVDLEASDALERRRTWIAEVRLQVLNITGSRDSRQAAIYGRAFGFLSRVFRTSN